MALASKGTKIFINPTQIFMGEEISVGFLKIFVLMTFLDL
jgi:hypothetical protein